MMNCRACNGFECKGGGNTICLRRDPHASHLAGIIDTFGSLRFVIAHRKTLKHHARPDELLLIVPGIVVHEPITWTDIPMVIGHIERWVDRWIVDNIPNEPHAREAVRMYRLRCLENPRRALDMNTIVET